MTEVAVGVPTIRHHDRLNAYTLACPKCGQLPDRFTMSRAYCSGEGIACSNCGASIDWWKTLLAFIKKNFMNTQVFALAGALECSFEVRLKKATRFTLRLADLGIPNDARVVSMNLTPAQTLGQVGALHCLVMHSNVLTRVSRIGGAEISMYPMPLFGDPEFGDISGSLTWIDGSNLGAVSSLVDALEAFTAGAFDEMIVPANVAMELAAERIARKYLSAVASKQNIEGFLDDVTYGHRLNVLLPLIARERGEPPLPDHPRGILNRLRGLRNDVAHTGRPEKPVDRDGASEMLAALVTGLDYAELLMQRLT